MADLISSLKKTGKNRKIFIIFSIKCTKIKKDNHQWLDVG